MTLGQLRALVAAAPAAEDDVEVKVWLPGSTIRLTNAGDFMRNRGMLMIEGNVDPGSALAGNRRGIS